MTDRAPPKVSVTVKVKILDPDGFYSASEFSPEFWEQHQQKALEFAHENHADIRAANEKAWL